MSSWAPASCPPQPLYQVFHSVENGRDWNNTGVRPRIVGTFWTLAEAETSAKSTISGLICECIPTYTFHKDRCGQERQLDTIKWSDTDVYNVHDRIALKCYEGQAPSFCTEANTVLLAEHAAQGHCESVWIEKTLMPAKTGIDTYTAATTCASTSKATGIFGEPRSTTSSGTNSLFTFASANSPSRKIVKPSASSAWD